MWDLFVFDFVCVQLWKVILFVLFDLFVRLFGCWFVKDFMFGLVLVWDFLMFDVCCFNGLFMGGDMMVIVIQLGIDDVGLICYIEFDGCD